MLYYQLVKGDKLSSLPPSLGKYRCLLLVRRPVDDSFRNHISRLLVNTGCQFAMAWGMRCSDWDDSIDWANTEKFNPNDIPLDQFVVTTWHEDESLEDVLSFAKHDALLSSNEQPLENLLVLDFAEKDDEPQIRELYIATA